MSPSKLPISFSAFSLMALVHRRSIASCGKSTTLPNSDFSQSDGTPVGSGQITSIQAFLSFSIINKSGPPPCEGVRLNPASRKRAASKASDTRAQKLCYAPEQSSSVKFVSAKPELTNALHACAISSRTACRRPPPGYRFSRKVSMLMRFPISVILQLII